MDLLRLLLRNMISAWGQASIKFWMGFMVSARPDWNPRQWSNREIQKLGTLFHGDIINVGAWRDEDKDGDLYVNYFPNACAYSIANYSGQDGASGLPGEKFIDLSKPCDGSLGTYDLVFSHTVLEHVYPPGVAFDHICALSRESILAVVPFIQCFHGRDGSYGDYARYSPLFLKEMFNERGFDIVYMNWNNEFPVMDVYIIVFATRNPSKYKELLPESPVPVVGRCGPGMAFNHLLWGLGPDRSIFRRVGEFIGSRLCISVRKSS